MITEPLILMVEDFIANGNELYAFLVTDIVWDERIRARKTATFGVPYNYSGMQYPVTPMHGALIPVLDNLETRLGFRPNNCLLNYYADGDSTMGFHSDSTKELAPGTGVAVISLGAERNITFLHRRKKQTEFHYLLRNGSLLYMPPEVQEEWRHGILPQENIEGRISLTFRQVIGEH